MSSLRLYLSLSQSHLPSDRRYNRHLWQALHLYPVLALEVSVIWQQFDEPWHRRCRELRRKVGRYFFSFERHY